MNQGLRLLLLPGLILGLTTMALSVLQTVSQAAPYLINIDQTILSPPIALTLFAWCGPIVLALCAFGFLRKRRASDVYHSVPVNRTCLYFSYTVAVIIWVFATILLTTVARDTVFIIAGGDFYAGSGNSTVMTLHLLQTCGLLLSTLKPLAVTLLVMAMSGTLVANLALTAILLYLPGIAGMFYRDALSSAVGWVYPMSYSGSSMLWGFGRPLSVRNELLSLAIALIYGFLGWLLFIKRRSEAAGPGAPASPVLHAICRIGVTLPFITYIPVMFLNNNWDQGAFIGLLVLALLAFVAYFTYELITTRRFISMLKAAPVFLVVAGLALGGGYALVGAKTFILNFRPKADDVRVVCINPAGRDKIGYVSHGSYNDQLAGEVWVNNTKAKTILCEALGGMLDNQPSDVYAEYTPVRTFETIFRTRFLNRRRNIRLTLDKYNELMVICCETSQEFKDAMIAMPKDSEITQYRLEGIPHENYEKIHEEAKEIFQIYREECKGLDLEKLLKLRDAERLYSDKYNGIYGPLIINVNGQSAKGYYYQAYHVTREETPETYEKMMALGSGERSSALAEALVNAKDTGLIVSFTGFTKWFNFHYNVSVESPGFLPEVQQIEDEVMQEITDILLRGREMGEFEDIYAAPDICRVGVVVPGGSEFNIVLQLQPEDAERIVYLDAHRLKPVAEREMRRLFAGAAADGLAVAIKGNGKLIEFGFPAGEQSATLDELEKLFTEAMEYPVYSEPPQSKAAWYYWVGLGPPADRYLPPEFGWYMFFQRDTITRLEELAGPDSAVSPAPPDVTPIATGG